MCIVRTQMQEVLRERPERDGLAGNSLMRHAGFKLLRKSRTPFDHVHPDINHQNKTQAYIR